MTSPRTLLLVMMLVPLLSGCVGDVASPPDAVGSAQVLPQEVSGGLVVTVLDATGAPVAGALVGAGDRENNTDASGVVRFLDIPPRYYMVHVRMEGYRDGFLGVHVEEGTVMEVEVSLLPGDHAVEAGGRDKEVYHLRGRYECSLTYLIITGDCMASLDNVSEQAGLAQRPGNLTDEEAILEFPLDVNWTTVVVEMAWRAHDTAGESMTLNVEPTEAPPDGHSARYARSNGTSPLLIRLDNGEPHVTASASADGKKPDLPDPLGGETLRARAFVQGTMHDPTAPLGNPGGYHFLGVGAAINQQFEIFATIFYDVPAPDGYSIAAQS